MGNVGDPREPVPGQNRPHLTPTAFGTPDGLGGPSGRTTVIDLWGDRDSAPLALIDLPTVALRLGVNQRHVRGPVAERRISFVKWGHLLRFDPAEVEAWLNAGRVSVEP